MWSYSGTASCKYGVVGIVPVRRVVLHLTDGVVFTARTDTLPFTDRQKRDLEWGIVPANLEEIATFAALEFCNRAPWSVA
jgi:hypothetical protein